MRALAFLLLFPVAAAAAPVEKSPWHTLAPGLELGTFDGPPCDIGDGKIRVVRVDPAYYEIGLANASAPGEGAAHTAREWAARTDAVAVINASMFRDDGKTSVVWMRARAHVNNPRVSQDRVMLAADPDPTTPSLPSVRLVDRDCDDWDALAARYRTLAQSIRMVSCKRAVTWKPQDRRWSTAAIGVDGKGRVLFIHARSPWPVHDLAARLLALPLDLAGAMYVEGGPEAQLYVHAGAAEHEWVGSFETGFFESDDNHEAWPIPNVVVARPRSAKSRATKAP